MGDAPQNAFVYLDANPIAYAMEGPEELADALKNLFSIFRRTPGVAVTSELTLAEVLPKRRIPDRHFFDLLIWSNTFDLRPVTREILIETATYRQTAGTGLPDGRIVMSKLPDAIHVVTAIQSGCRAFFSSDGRVKLPDTIKLIRASKDGVEALMQEMT